MFPFSYLQYIFPPRKRLQGVVALPEVCLLNIFFILWFQNSCFMQLFSCIYFCSYLVASCRVFPCSRCGPLIVVRGLQSEWIQELRHTGLRCGVLFPQWGIEHLSPALQVGFLTTGPPEKSLEVFRFSMFLRFFT